MIRTLTQRHRRFSIRWTNFVRRWALAVVVLSALSVVTSVVYIAGNIALNTDTTDMLAADLPFRKAWREEDEAFPQFDNTVVVVVEGETPDLADDGAAALTARMRRQPGLFGSVFYPQGDGFFRRNGFLYLDIDDLYELSDRLAAAQPFLGALSADPSLRGLFGILALAVDRAGKVQGGVPIEMAPMLDAIAGVVEAQAAGRFARLSWQRLMSAGEEAGEEEERADRLRLIVIQPPLHFESLQPAAPAMDGIRAIARDLKLDEAHGVTVRITGEAALESEELETVAVGMEVAGGLSLVLVIGLLLLCYHSLRIAVATLLTLIAGLIWTTAFAVAAVGALNLISIAFAVLFIGLGVDFGIHYALRYREALGAGADHVIALRRAVSGVGGALTLSAVAAAIGFYSFLPTDYVGLAELGLIAGTGMGIALFANTTLLPALLTLFHPRSPTSWGAVGTLAGRTTHAVERHARPIIWGALAVGIAAAALIPWARFDFDPLNLQSRETESVATLLDLMKEGENFGYFISVVTEDLDRARMLAERAASLAPVRSTLTAANFVPRDQDEKLDIVGTMALILEPSLTGQSKPPPGEEEAVAALADLKGALGGLAAGERGDDSAAAARLSAAFAALPGGGEDAASLAELRTRLLAGLSGRLEALRDSLRAEPVTLEDLPADLRQRFVAADGRARLQIYPKANIQQDSDALRDFVEAVRTVAPEATGPPVIILEAGRTVVRAFLQAAGLAVVAITILLAVLLRNLRDIAMVFAPLVLAALLTVAASVVFNLPFNFANVIVLPLLFGLGVAGSLQLVMREIRERGTVGVLSSSTPRAILFSAFTTIGSFGSLALSGHPGTASMGLLLTIAITLSMVCTLVVLPALMATFGPTR
jgi:hopanoid biosynthesis associated RND transporter like protein HpnN